MAMTKCRECQHDISTSATACPHCGSKAKRKTSVLTKIVAALFGVVVLSMVLSSLDSTKHPIRPALTPEQQAEKDTKERAFQTGLRNARAAMATLIASMRDPSSFTAHLVGIDETGTIVCIEYRAKNGFGGMNVGFATLANNHLSNNDSALWNKHCAGKAKLRDIRAAL